MTALENATKSLEKIEVIVAANFAHERPEVAQEVRRLAQGAMRELEQLRTRLAAAEVATLQALLDEIDGSVYVEVWDYIKQKRDAAALSEREPAAQPSEQRDRLCRVCGAPATVELCRNHYIPITSR